MEYLEKFYDFKIQPYCGDRAIFFNSIVEIEA